MHRIRKASVAGNAQLPSGDGQVASIIWIEAKLDAEGKPVKEVIYELQAEPDLFRQITLPEELLYQGAKRGDAVLVETISLEDETTSK